MEKTSPEKVLQGKKTEAAETGARFSFSRYLKEVRQEFNRISWPTRNQVLRESLVVLVMVTLITIFVSLLDYLFNFLFTWLIK